MNIIITGASRGIGEALVKRFHKEDNNQLFLLARDKPKLEKIKNELRNRISLFPIDLTSTESIKEFAETIKQTNIKIDLLINNAGYLVNKTLVNQSEEDIQKQININLLAPIMLVQALLPSINNNAQILNVTSMGGVQGTEKFGGLSIYSAAKGGLNTLTEVLATELSQYKITVNALALGAIQTEMLEKAFPDFSSKVFPEDISEEIFQLSNSYTRFVTGKIIQLNQGTPS